MATSAELGVMPALDNASFTFSSASGGVTTYHAEPSSFKSSAPASSTISSILSSLADSLGTVISPLRLNIQPTAPASAHEVPEFTDHAIAVRGNRLDQHANSARPIAFKHHFFILLALELAGAAHDGAFDIVVRHVLVLGGQNGRA